MKYCNRCDQKANININVLNYCNSCFEKQFITKIETQLKNLDHRSNLMFCFPKSHDFFIFQNALQIFFNKKMIEKIYILSLPNTNIYGLSDQKKNLNDNINVCNNNLSNDKLYINKEDHLKDNLLYLDISSDNYNDYIDSNKSKNHKNKQNSKIFIKPVFKFAKINDITSEWEDELNNGIVNEKIKEYCRSKSIKVICLAKSLESILTFALEKICHGNGIDAVKSVRNMIDNEIRLINIFTTIKEKEIIYYLYLKKYLRTYKENIQSKTNYILKDFLLEIDNKNGLALFNILNTLKKLNNI